MSSSTFTQRWTSVNDLTTNSNNNKNLASFFLQPSLLSDSNNITVTSRPSQSLISLVKQVSLPSADPSTPSSPPPIPPRPSEQTKRISPRVANIIHQFESQSILTVNNQPMKVSLPARSLFTRIPERNCFQHSPVVDTPSKPIPLNCKKHSKPQPIIVYERITQHEKVHKFEFTSPPMSPKNSVEHSKLQNKIIFQQNVESDTDSAIHTMAAVINPDKIYSATISRSSTTDSTCSSLSSSESSSIPHFPIPKTASTQNQYDITPNSTCYERTSSPPSSVTSLDHTISSATSIIHEDLRSSEPLSFATRFSLSEINLAGQYHRLSSPDVVQSDTNLSENSMKQSSTNTNMPLRYKRDSFIRLYG